MSFAPREGERMAQLRSQFARRLKTLRNEKQLTQEELAKITGLSTSFISSLERGINAPSFETLERIAKALGVSVRALFDVDS
jgi:transcriptional regulator with XRE-family HTH domain